MGFVLPGVKTSKSGAQTARQVIPADVRDEYKRLYGKRREERWRAKAGTSPAEAKRQYADWVSEINRRIQAIRASQRGDGITLTQKDALALAGEWYVWFVARHEDAPGDPKRWDAEIWHLIDALREHAPDEVLDQHQSDLEWTRDPNVRQGIRPLLADLGHTAQFLAGRGLSLTNEARAQFLDCVLDNYIQALWLLERRAKADYEADEPPKQFPTFTAGRKQASATAHTPWKLFEGWVAAKKPGGRTVNRWRAVFEDLESTSVGQSLHHGKALCGHCERCLGEFCQYRVCVGQGGAADIGQSVRGCVRHCATQGQHCEKNAACSCSAKPHLTARPRPDRP